MRKEKSNYVRRGLPLFIALSVTAFYGCENDDVAPDITAPQIELNKPAMDENVSAGTNILLDAVFMDDQALGTYSIDIHNNFDGHTHGRLLEDPDLVKFSYKKSFNLPREKVYAVNMSDEIIVPANTMAGPYHFIVQAIDAAGNATSYQDDSTVEIEIMITNESMAQIEITNLQNDELEIEIDQPFIVEGKITDPDHASLQGVGEVLITLGEAHEHDHDHGRLAEEHLFEIEIEEEELPTYENPDGTLDISRMIDYTLDQSTADELEAESTDHLEMMIKVIDKQGNYTISKIPVHIHLEWASYTFRVTVFSSYPEITFSSESLKVVTKRVFIE